MVHGHRKLIQVFCLCHIPEVLTHYLCQAFSRCVPSGSTRSIQSHANTLIDITKINKLFHYTSIAAKIWYVSLISSEKSTEWRQDHHQRPYKNIPDWACNGSASQMGIYKKAHEADRNGDKKQLDDVEGRRERVIIDVS